MTMFNGGETRNETINEGDVVTVFFSTHDCILEAVVLYKPCATGDSWHLNCDGDIFYVQQFDYMRLVRKGVKP